MDKVGDSHSNIDVNHISSFAGAVKQAVIYGGFVKVDGTTALVVTKKSERMSSHAIAQHALSLVKTPDGKISGTLGQRLEAFQDMKDSLKLQSRKVDNSFKAKLFNKLGRKTKSQIELGQATSLVNLEAARLKAKLELECPTKEIIKKATEKLDKKTMEGPSKEMIRKLAFHRCLDRFELHASDENKAVISKGLGGAFSSSLEGMPFDETINSMSNEISTLLNHDSYKGNYSDSEKKVLLNVADQLKWSGNNAALTVPTDRNIEEASKGLEHKKDRLEATKGKIQNLQNLKEKNIASSEIIDQMDQRDKGMCLSSGLLNPIMIQIGELRTLISKTEGEDLKTLQKDKANLEEKAAKIKEAIKAVEGGRPTLSAIEVSSEEIDQCVTEYEKGLTHELTMISANITQYQKELDAAVNKLNGSVAEIQIATGQIVDQIKTKVNSTQGVMFAGGTAGHAMLYSVNQQANGKYSFSVFNTGKGISQHHHQHPTDKSKVQTAAVWSDLTLEQASDPDLIQSLLRIKQKIEPKVGNDTEGPVDKIYYAMEDHLGKIKDSASKNEDDYHKSQEKGTCTEQVIQAWMHTQVPPDLYKKFKADLTSHTIEMFETIAHGTPEGMAPASPQRNTSPELDKAMLAEMKNAETRRQGKLSKKQPRSS